MFNLEQKIKEWRRQLAAQGIQAQEVLNELEGHLREEMERQIQSGAKEQRAYEVARARLGDADSLSPEFAKTRETNRAARFLTACSVVFAACVLLVNTWNLLSFEMSALERTAGFTAVSLICLYV